MLRWSKPGEVTCRPREALVAINIPHTDIELEFRHKELSKAVQDVCSGHRFISLKYIYGENNKEAIAQSCVRFVYERNVFSGGILYWDLRRDTLC